MPAAEVGSPQPGGVIMGRSAWEVSAGLHLLVEQICSAAVIPASWLYADARLAKAAG